MNGWQITIIVLMAINVLAGAYMHGKESTKQVHNFWINLIAQGIYAFILYKGGFF